jgi:hypothetical protein
MSPMARIILVKIKHQEERGLWVPYSSKGGLCWQPTRFFDYSQKAAYTPCGIMTNHCRFIY